MGYWGFIFLAIWLTLFGLVSLFHVSFRGINFILPLLSLTAGLLMLADGFSSRFKNNLGKLFLSIWLILEGIQAFIRIGNIGVISAILAIIAGVLILIKK